MALGECFEKQLMVLCISYVIACSGRPWLAGRASHGQRSPDCSAPALSLPHRYRRKVPGTLHYGTSSHPSMSHVPWKPAFSNITFKKLKSRFDRLRRPLCPMRYVSFMKITGGNSHEDVAGASGR